MNHAEAGSGIRPETGPIQRPRRELVFHAFSTREWRVCDSRYPSTDIRGLLGFVQRRGELFEVVRVGHPMVRCWYTSLEETRRHFQRPHTFMAPLPWHLPVIDPDASFDEDEELAEVIPVESAGELVGAGGAAVELDRKVAS